MTNVLIASRAAGGVVMSDYNFRGVSQSNRGFSGGAYFEPQLSIGFGTLYAGIAAGESADQLKARLTLSGLAAQIQKVSIEGRGGYYRVRLGPFSKIEELDAATQQLQQAGLKPIRLKVKKEGA